MNILSKIKSDLSAAKGKTDILHILLYLIFSHNKRPLILLRLMDLKFFFPFSKWFLRMYYHIEVRKGIDIGAPFRMEHPRGIILGCNKIGNNCLIGQWVTIGGNNCKRKTIAIYENTTVPVIGDNVQIYAGAVVAGPIVIGNDVIIAANATVTKDIPNNTLVYNQTGISSHKVLVPGVNGPFYYI